MKISKEELNRVHIPKGHNDWAYQMTDAAINKLVDSKEQCDYLLATQGDNTYLNNFLGKYIHPHMTAGYQMIGFNWIDRATDPILQPARFFWQMGQCDLGSILFKFSLFSVEKERFTTEVPNLSFYAADGYLVEKIFRKTKNVVIVRQFLYAHQ